ncbi:MAG: 3D domain-containing protein [Patescibacteria group bacterium]
MMIFLKKLVRFHIDFYQRRFLPFLLIFSFGINSLSFKLDAKKKTGINAIDYGQKQGVKNKSQKGDYILSDNTFLSLNPNFSLAKNTEAKNVKKKTAKSNRKVKVTLTAYSSTVSQCDGNPFRTASGTRVKDGTVAVNFLPFGTKIKIPSLFGDKIFTVEDRMSNKYWYKVDIWMPSYQEAIKFGKRHSEIVILR